MASWAGLDQKRTWWLSAISKIEFLLWNQYVGSYSRHLKTSFWTTSQYFHSPMLRSSSAVMTQIVQKNTILLLTVKRIRNRCQGQLVSRVKYCTRLCCKFMETQLMWRYLRLLRKQTHNDFLQKVMLKQLKCEVVQSI